MEENFLELIGNFGNFDEWMVPSQASHLKIKIKPNNMRKLPNFQTRASI